MENYERDEFWQEPVAQEQQEPAFEEVVEEVPQEAQAPICQYEEDQPVSCRQEEAQPVEEAQTYRGAGVGRKESPFADSPYVMNHPPRQDTYVPPIPPQKPKKAKKVRKPGSGKAWKAVLCALLVVVLAAGSSGVTAAVINNLWQNKTDVMLNAFQQQMDGMQAQIDAAAAKQDEIIARPALTYTVTAPGAIYQQNVQAVVLITSKVTGSNIFGQTTTGSSTGSGFVITEDGYVVTNHHVVDGASDIKVTLHGGTEYPAKLIGSDSTNDVALLKITEEVQLQAVSIGSSDALNVGDQVVAIGNPLGELTSTLTVGYVSAKERDVTTDGKTINMIQTDAAINSGNSGGPLFNSQGEVVGITTAKYSGSSSSGATIEGIGFAIPIDDVMPLVNDLMNYGYINSAYLGVMVSEMDANTAAYYGLPVGAYVQEVTAGNCAEKAGLKAKDIIVALGNYEIQNINDLTKVLRKFKAGDTTTITVFRGGQELQLSITLDAKPQENKTEIPAPSGGKLPENGDYEDWYNYFFGGKG